MSSGRRRSGSLHVIDPRRRGAPRSSGQRARNHRQRRHAGAEQGRPPPGPGSPPMAPPRQTRWARSRWGGPRWTSWPAPPRVHAAEHLRAPMCGSNGIHTTMEALQTNLLVYVRVVVLGPPRPTQVRSEREITALGGVGLGHWQAHPGSTEAHPELAGRPSGSSRQAHPGPPRGPPSKRGGAHARRRPDWRATSGRCCPPGGCRAGSVACCSPDRAGAHRASPSRRRAGRPRVRGARGGSPALARRTSTKSGRRSS